MIESTHRLQAEMLAALGKQDITPTETLTEEVIDGLIAAADMDLTPEQEELVRAYWRKSNREERAKPVKMPAKTWQGLVEVPKDLPKVKTEYMRYDAHGSKGPGVYCTCGAHKLHNRGKVLARWADKHFEKTGHKWLRT